MRSPRRSLPTEKHTMLSFCIRRSYCFLQHIQRNGLPCTCVQQYLSTGETGSIPPAGFKEIKKTVSSLRADAIASFGLSLSRRFMWQLCLEGMVTRNGVLLQKKSTNVKEGDIIDVYVKQENDDTRYKKTNSTESVSKSSKVETDSTESVSKSSKVETDSTESVSKSSKVETDSTESTSKSSKESYRKGRVIVKEIGGLSKKGRHFVTLHRHRVHEIVEQPPDAPPES